MNLQREAGLARSASILGLGNIASRIIGLAREAIISGYFGSSGELSAFKLAARVPTMLYDLLVGGMLSAALVPVLSEYTRLERRQELTKAASAILSLIAVVMGAIVLALELLAVPIAGVLGDFEDPALQETLARMLRVIAPAVLLFGLSGGVTGLLYALKRFNYTAISGAVFNMGIVIAAPLLAGRIGVYALPLGIVAGSIMQLAVMAPGLRDLRLRFSALWRHLAVRRILRLYVPIVLGLIVTQMQIIVDGRWASATGEYGLSWMGYATTLIQLPLGLVPVAVSLAALPTLSQHAAVADWEGFRNVFARGLRLVLLLLVPATIGLWALSVPVVRLLFQHGAFGPYDTYWTALALRLYLIGLMFAGVDFLLNYTFYARQDTRTPAIVGVVSVGFYFIAALLLKGPLGFLGLVLADSVKQFGHMTIMVVLLLRSVGRLRSQQVLSTLVKATGAALLMGGMVWAIARWLEPWAYHGLIGKAAVVILAGGAGALFYLAALHRLEVPEVVTLSHVLATRFGKPIRWQ
ncbi:MAG: murein biosynthesis integral membrane protein MurJ [Anaerolineae bacterium]